ncbi:unnamed protein product [Linum trigynum]|uniref:Uncharacterized protein n=1 Tax=Linum trigynum TaxID=586398 RepID=A0AAV2EUM7_9ROSI
MSLILGRTFLATAKALIDVNEGNLILRDGEEQITFSVDPKSKKDDVKKVESNGMFGSGGEPLKANPTSSLAPCDDVKKGTKAGTKPEGRKKKAWFANMRDAFTQKKDKSKEKVADQEGTPLDFKMGGDKPRPETVVDPISEASCSPA